MVRDGTPTSASRLIGSIFLSVESGLQRDIVAATRSANAAWAERLPVLQNRMTFLSLGISSMRPSTSRHSMLRAPRDRSGGELCCIPGVDEHHAIENLLRKLLGHNYTCLIGGELHVVLHGFDGRVLGKSRVDQKRRAQQGDRQAACKAHNICSFLFARRVSRATGHLPRIGSFRPRPRPAGRQPSIRDSRPQAGGRDNRARAAPRRPRTTERNRDRGNRR